MNNKIKVYIMIFALLLCVGLAVAIELVKEQAVRAYNPNNLIRFHIMANSNSPVDQAIKLQVRDVVVAAMAAKFNQARNIKEAKNITRQNLNYIQQLAVEKVRAAGKDYPVAVEMGSYFFPARIYCNNLYDFMLPAGKYEAVRVVIGQGLGANWWCVLFPPLCFTDPGSMMQVEKTGDSAVPAFRLKVPEAMTAQATIKKNDENAWAASKVNEYVEFRFKILDFFHGLLDKEKDRKKF